MHEFDGDVRGVGRIRSATERKERTSAAEAGRHLARRVRDARRLAREESRDDRIARAQPVRDRARARARLALGQHIRGSGSPTSMSIARVPP